MLDPTPEQPNKVGAGHDHVRGARFFWRRESAHGRVPCWLPLVRAWSCTIHVQRTKAVKEEGCSLATKATGVCGRSDRARGARRSMGSAEVAGTRGRLGAAGSVCPLSLYGDLVFLWRLFVVGCCLFAWEALSVVFLLTTYMYNCTRPTYASRFFPLSGQELRRQPN